MAEFRNILADGDLIRQRKAVGWWLFGGSKSKWQPYRNLSREVRFLEERMHAAHAAYKAAQEDYVVAHKNVNVDMDMLRMHKMDNSEVVYEIPSDESILTRRDGVKYSSGNSGQKQKGQNGNGNNGQNQNGGGNGGGNNQNQNQNQNGNKQKQKQQPKSLLELFSNAKVILH